MKKFPKIKNGLNWINSRTMLNFNSTLRNGYWLATNVIWQEDCYCHRIPVIDSETGIKLIKTNNLSKQKVKKLIQLHCHEDLNIVYVCKIDIPEIDCETLNRKKSEQYFNYLY